MDDILLEPSKAFKERYEKQFDDNANAMFESLVRSSGIDREQNRATAARYRDENGKAHANKLAASRLKTLRVVLIILSVLGFIAALVSCFPLAQGNFVAGGVTLGVGLAVPAICIPLIPCIINKRIKEATERHETHANQAKICLEEARKQMSALNSLFETNMTKRLIEQTVPALKLDDRFDMRRYDYLHGKYGFGNDSDRNRSTVAVLTGEILGNPYLMHRRLVQFMGTHTYYGSIVIHWTTTYTDKDGNTQTEHHSQTLTASVTKPKPFYNYETELVYGNEAAPDLSFSRSAAHTERLGEKALERKVKAGEKDIRKKREKAVKTGGGFTEMGNSEFDVLFGALDRNHEVQFRLMFTPLAQKNMLALIKDDTYYGDDFSFRKRGCLNYISSEHAANFDFDTSYARYASYDADLAKENFLSFNRTFFRSLYFDLAPLLSVPLYQQHKPKEYIYGTSYGRNYTDCETEYAANKLGEDSFAPNGACTRSILKADFVGRDGKSDKAQITAYSFRTKEHTSFIPVHGGDGCTHSVPVNWLEYIPVENTSTVNIKQLDMSDKEFESACARPALNKALAPFGTARVFTHGLLCCIVDDKYKDFDRNIENAIKNSRFQEVK